MYYICHKCKLPRAKAKSDPDLGWCTCLGQTWFPYEETGRTEEETRALATEQYHEWVALYEHQHREPYYYEQLAKEYRKAVKLS